MATPICPYFGTCGGCTSQHLNYAVQLENKKKQLVTAIGFGNVAVFSDKEYGYRNRMDFIFHQNGLGFRQKGKWFLIVDIEHCPISDERINILLKEVRTYFKDADTFNIKKHTGTFRYAVIRVADNETSISFVLNEDSTTSGKAIDKIKEFANKSTAGNIIVTYNPAESDVSISEEYFVVKGKDVLEATYLGKTFEYSIQGFFQNNHVMAEKMQKYVNELLKEYAQNDKEKEEENGGAKTINAHLLDLYGGVGTFGIINAELFKSVTIIENVQQCIDAANKNIEKNKITNAKAIVLDAMHLKKLSFPKPLFVITDPPRSGMHPKTIEHLNALEPEIIVYVSCNVQQLAKDVLKFKNYTIKSAALFDLFPQTNHSEAVVELALK